MVHWTADFKKVMIDPPSVDETIQILENIKFKYEEHHHVLYSNERFVLQLD